MCPWLDIEGSKSATGLDIVVLANSSKPLMSSILWLASEHYTSIALQPGMNFSLNAVTFHQQATEGLEFEPDNSNVRQIGGCLLTLKELLGSKPQQWTNILARSKVYDTIASLASSEETIDSLFWALLKFDLAASIMGKYPPKISTRALRDIVNRLTFRSGARYDCQAALLRLGGCLHIVYGTNDSLSPVPNGSNRQDSTTSETQLTNFWSRWTTLWRECQDWHKHRTMEVQPLLVVDSIEVSSNQHPRRPILPNAAVHRASRTCRQRNVLYNILSVARSAAPSIKALGSFQPCNFYGMASSVCCRGSNQ
ncbi:hypothetical protein V8C34DRAFT_276984 [Trichoderma compactum]